MPFSSVPESQKTMCAIVAEKAESSPTQRFAVDVEGRSLNWATLNDARLAWADRFVELGIRKDDVVCTILDSGLQSLSLWLGLASIGGIDASINSEFRGRMLAHALKTCQPSLIVCDAAYLPHLLAIADELESLPTVLSLGDHPDGSADARVRTLATLPPASGQSSDFLRCPQWHDIAAVTFTSGTTGPSKAVKLPWGQLNAINLGTFPIDDMNDGDVFYCFTSHAHFGAKSIPYNAAMVGAQVLIRSRFSIKSFWPDITKFGVTTACLVGTMADMLMQDPESPQGKTTLRNLFMAPLGPSYQKFADRYDLRIATVYNSTENGVPICSGWRPDNARSIGRRREGYPGFEVRIVDEHDNEVPDGTPGECIVRSAVPWTMNAGYLNNPEATAVAWRNGWFHTGDALVRNPAGDYSFVDRLKDVIRRRGENISSFEVEADVKLNPDVAECAAIAVPADTTEDEILLFVSKRPGSSLDAAGLCAEIETRMTRFMVPRYIEIIESFPKTQATERILKTELRRRGLGPRTWDRQHRRYIGDPAAPELAAP